MKTHRSHHPKRCADLSRSKRRRRFHFQQCEPRHLLATLIDAGDLGSGVAVSDDVTGSGFVMYSAESVHARFDDVNANNADHFAAVRFTDGRWEYNNDSTWVEFLAAKSDLLVATVDFDAGVATRLEDTVQERTVRRIGGMDMGYLEGDLFFAANQWNGLTNAGDVEIIGSYFSAPISQAAGSLNAGVAVADDATGTGYIMFSVENVHTRFRGMVNPDNADHFVAVRPADRFWEFNNDQAWVRFKQQPTDRLVARVDFAADTIEPIAERADPQRIAGLTAGFVHGDLEFTAQMWNGVAEEGEFGITGSYFQVWHAAKAPDSADNLHDLTLAMRNFESTNGRLPAHAIYSSDGQPLLSWRVNILPYLGYEELYAQFRLEEPWNSSHNLGLLSEMPRVFASPHAPHQPLSAGPSLYDCAETVYQVVTGDDTMFPVSDRGLRLADATDGTSNTALMVETDADRATPWTKPQDLVFDGADPLSGLGNITKAGFNTVLATGETLQIPGSVDAGLWNHLVTRNDGQFVDLRQIAEPLEPADSLRQLATAALNYESATQQLPVHAIYDDGQALLSWRVRILPYIDQADLYHEFRLDEPWDSAHNLALLPKMPRVFAPQMVDGHKTNYLAFVGSDTTFPLPAEPTSARGLRLGDILDGVSNTILFAEANPEAAVEWTRPQDIAYDSADPLSDVGSVGGFEFQVALADGSVLAIPNGVPADVLHQLVTRNDGEVVDPKYTQPFNSAAENLRAFSIAALDIEIATNRLPAHAIYSTAGQPLLSWRVQILPLIGQQNLYNQFHLDEPWDSPHNLSLLSLMPRVFAHPQVVGYQTNYLAMTGERTAFPIDAEGRALSGFVDGLSRSVFFVEADADQAVLWTQPQDILFDPADPLAGVTNIIETGFHVVTGDGSSRLISGNVDPAEFTRMVLIDDEQEAPLRVMPVSRELAFRESAERTHRPTRLQRFENLVDRVFERFL